MAANTTSKAHPATQWASEQLAENNISQTDRDCTTTVVLKILDGKCKMLPGEKDAIMKIYDVLLNGASDIFAQEMFTTIERARIEQPTPSLFALIHELRIYAEESIPKSTMKRYKAKLRDGLFG